DRHDDEVGASDRVCLLLHRHGGLWRGAIAAVDGLGFGPDRRAALESAVPGGLLSGGAELRLDGAQNGACGDVSFPRRSIGNSGLKVTELGFGTAPLGNLFRPLPDSVAQ